MTGLERQENGHGLGQRFTCRCNQRRYLALRIDRRVGVVPLRLGLKVNVPNLVIRADLRQG